MPRTRNSSQSFPPKAVLGRTSNFVILGSEPPVDGTRSHGNLWRIGVGEEFSGPLRLSQVTGVDVEEGQKEQDSASGFHISLLSVLG